jgi:asparagine N-glycosylation enzyme membrane subunit Stt3
MEEQSGIVKIEKEHTSEDTILKERKEKFINFFKNNNTWAFIIVLILLVALGFYIRNLPLSDHNGKPGLWDYTTNDYTLGPDLDPFLFLRYAKVIIANGSLPQVDLMRNVPLGFGTVGELPMVAHMIVYTYKLVNLFGSYSINYAGAFMPVIFFLLTIISFFFFVREIFMRKDEAEKKLKANLIASISTLFMIILPGFLSRTIAGIPEKESVGFFFMFLAFYLFLKAWKSEKLITASIYSILTGIVTALMGLTWGGVIYIYIAVAFATFIAFFLNKVKLKETIIYLLWLAISVLITFIFTTHYSLMGFVTSLDSGLASFVAILLIVNAVLIKSNLRSKISQKTKLPENIAALLTTIALGIIAVLILFGPSFFIDKFNDLNRILFNPVTGRWSTTVAENRQPYFQEWVSNFGEVVFWLFFVGSVLLFYKMFNKINKRDAIIITLTYALFFMGLVFSRYAAHPNLFDGENFISKFFYYGSALLLIGTVIYYYNLYHKEKNDSFEKIEFEYIFLFALFVLTLFTARGAVRLIMVLVPIAPIFLSYLIVELGFMTKHSQKDKKILMLIIFLIVLCLGAYYSYQYYNEIKSQAYNTVPYYYTVQWQNAMSWVRNNTATDAVFAHWWDYGYWVQSIGERATVTDGGNIIVWWNYLTGRLVLTGDNQKDALEFLYNHNATHLLIDSTDIGKYGAYSQIGSDENFDRFSSGPITLFSNQKQIQETKEGITRSYVIPASNGQVMISGLEEDITFYKNSTNITLYKENSGFIGTNVKYSSDDNSSISFTQPEALFVSNGQQMSIPMRYLYYNHKLMDYKNGLNATVYLIPYVSSNSIDYMGAALYISPRLMRGLFAQVYLLDNSMGNFNNFELAHSEKDLFTNQLESQGYNLNDFNYFYNVGLQGPIKIWQIKYTGQEKVNPEYLLRLPPPNITWQF